MIQRFYRCARCILILKTTWMNQRHLLSCCAPGITYLSLTVECVHARMCAHACCSCFSIRATSKMSRTPFRSRWVLEKVRTRKEVIEPCLHRWRGIYLAHTWLQMENILKQKYFIAEHCVRSFKCLKCFLALKCIIIITKRSCKFNMYTCTCEYITICTISVVIRTCFNILEHIQAFESRSDNRKMVKLNILRFLNWASNIYGRVIEDVWKVFCSFGSVCF